jgi:hypothetical protein
MTQPDAEPQVQAYNGTLNFATDAWTSPNGRAFIAVTVHMEMDGSAESMLLDIIECAHSHTGPNLAATFEKVLDNFGISDKVRSLKKKKKHKAGAIRNRHPLM